MLLAMIAGFFRCGRQQVANLLVEEGRTCIISPSPTVCAYGPVDRKVDSSSIDARGTVKMAYFEGAALLQRRCRLHRRNQQRPLRRARADLASWSFASCSLRGPNRPAIASCRPFLGSRTGGNTREAMTYRIRGTGARYRRSIAPLLPPCRKRSLVEPEVFVALAVVNAVDHEGQPLQRRGPA